MLAWRERSLSTEGSCGTDAAEIADNGGGTSALGVGKTRIVRGADRFTGEPVDVAPGLGGTELVEASDTVRRFLGGPSAPRNVAVAGTSFSASFVAAAMSNLPGCCRFDEAEAAVLGPLVTF